MKNFISQALLFLLPVLLIGSMMEILLRRIPNDYRFKKTYLDKHSDSLQVLFLGNSHIYYGINPEFINPKSFNASYVSQSYDYDLAILNKYNNKWSRLKYIVLPVDYGAFYKKLESGAGAWRIKNYNIYYDIHQNGNIAYYSELLSINIRKNLLRLYQYYYHHDATITSSALGWGTAYSSNKKQDLLITGKSAAQRHTASNDKFFNGIRETLIAMILFARKMNVRVILISCPAYKIYIQNLDQAQLNRTVNEATKLSSQYDNVSYFNLLGNEAFKEEDFYDADHLNEMGAKKFSLMLDSLIETYKVKANLNNH